MGFELPLFRCLMIALLLATQTSFTFSFGIATGETPTSPSPDLNDLNLWSTVKIKLSSWNWQWQWTNSSKNLTASFDESPELLENLSSEWKEELESMINEILTNITQEFESIGLGLTEEIAARFPVLLSVSESESIVSTSHLYKGVENAIYICQSAQQFLQLNGTQQVSSSSSLFTSTIEIGLSEVIQALNLMRIPSQELTSSFDRVDDLKAKLVSFLQTNQEKESEFSNQTTELLNECWWIVYSTAENISSLVQPSLKTQAEDSLKSAYTNNVESLNQEMEKELNKTFDFPSVWNKLNAASRALATVRETNWTGKSARDWIHETIVELSIFNVFVKSPEISSQVLQHLFHLEWIQTVGKLMSSQESELELNEAEHTNLEDDDVKSTCLMKNAEALTSKSKSWSWWSSWNSSEWIQLLEPTQNLIDNEQFWAQFIIQLPLHLPTLEPYFNSERINVTYSVSNFSEFCDRFQHICPKKVQTSLKVNGNKKISELNSFVDVYLRSKLSFHVVPGGLLVSGRSVCMSDVTRQAEASKNLNISSVIITATQEVILDTNFEGPKINLEVPVNLIILSPKWIISNYMKIVLRGIDGPKLQPVKAGGKRKRGGKGNDGLPGLAGSDGGTFIGIGHDFQGQLFKVDTSGGNGGRGQDGQDGGRGKDGKDMTIPRDKDPDYLCESTYGILTEEKLRFLAWASINEIGVDNISTIISNGYRVVGPFELFGERGTKGGDGVVGGTGGAGGRKGLAVLIDLSPKHHDVDGNYPTMHVDSAGGNDGAEGGDGKGGEGGHRGRSLMVNLVGSCRFWKIFCSCRLQDLGHSMPSIDTQAESGQDGDNGVIKERLNVELTWTASTESISFDESSTISSQSVSTADQRPMRISKEQQRTLLTVLLSYKKEMIENFFKNPFSGLSGLLFIQKIDEHHQVRNLSSSSNLFGDLVQLSRLYSNLRVQNVSVFSLSRTFIPLFTSLKDRSEQLSSNLLKTSDTLENRTALSHIHSSALQTILKLEAADAVEPLLFSFQIEEKLTDLEKMLEEVTAEVKVKKSIQIIHEKSLTTNEKLKGQFEEATKFFLTDLFPIFQNFEKTLEDLDISLANEIKERSEAKHWEISRRRVKESHLRSALVYHTISNTFKVVSLSLFTLGIYGAVIGPILFLGLVTTDSFFPTNTSSSSSLFEQLPESVRKSTKSSMDYLAAHIDEASLNMDAKLDVLEKSLVSDPNEADISEMIDAQTRVKKLRKEHEENHNKVKELRKRLENSPLDPAVLSDLSDALNFAEKTDEEIKTVVSESRATLQNRRAKNDREAKKIKMAATKLDEGTRVADAAVSLFKTFKNNTDSLEIALSETVKARKELDKLKEHGVKVNRFLPSLIQLMNKGLKRHLVDLGQKSSVGLEISSWGMSEMLKNFEAVLEDFILGFIPTEKTVKRVFTQIRELLGVYYQLFNRLEHFSHLAQLETTLTTSISAGLNPDQMKDSTQKNIVQTLTMEMTISELRRQYEIVLHNLKILMFPFFEKYLGQFLIPFPAELVDSSQDQKGHMENSLEIYRTNFKLMSSQYKNFTSFGFSSDSKEGGTFREGSFGWTCSVDMDSDVKWSSPPLNIWKWEENKELIQKILRGENVRLDSHISKSPKNMDAIKVTQLDLVFRIRNNSLLNNKFQLALMHRSLFVSHLGNSRYRFQDKTFLVPTPTLTFVFYAASRDENGNQVGRNTLYRNLKKGYFMISPYATLEAQLVPRGEFVGEELRDLTPFVDQPMDMTLIGKGTYVDATLDKPLVQLGENEEPPRNNIQPLEEGVDMEIYEFLRVPSQFEKWLEAFNLN